MATRSTYRIRETYRDAKGRKKYSDLCLVYFQYDGYPSGHPSDTAKWLASGKVVNGISIHEKDDLIFNGAGCLAAQFVEYCKDGPGGTYLFPLNSRGKSWEEYTYDIVIDTGTDEIKYIAYDVPWNGNGSLAPVKLWEGKPEDFEKFVEEYEKSDI